MAPPTIKVIFWDLGNVLLFFQPRLERLWRLATLFSPILENLRRPAGELRQKFLDCLAREGVLDLAQPGEDTAWRLNTGKVTQVQLYRAFLKAISCTTKQVPQHRFWSTYQLDLEPIPEVCELVRETKSRGVLAIAAANGEMWTGPDLLSLKCGIRWDGAVMSWQVGTKKPAEKFFAECKRQAETARQRNLDWPECLLVDDVPEYVAGFQALGGKAIKFCAHRNPAVLAERIAALRRKLEKYGALPLCRE